MNDSDRNFLLRSIEVAWRSRRNGNHPFGALLVDGQGNILLEAENTVLTTGDVTGHAELNLVRQASQRFGPEVLSTCTLYSSTEPCAMCAGAIYWGNIRRLVFALSEAGLREMTGNHPENPTLALPCREVFARGQQPIRVVGPDIEDEARKVHMGFW